MLNVSTWTSIVFFLKKPMGHDDIFHEKHKVTAKTCLFLTSKNTRLAQFSNKRPMAVFFVQFKTKVAKVKTKNSHDHMPTPLTSVLTQFVPCTSSLFPCCTARKNRRAPPRMWRLASVLLSVKSNTYTGWNRLHCCWWIHNFGHSFLNLKWNPWKRNPTSISIYTSKETNFWHVAESRQDIGNLGHWS